MSLELTQEDFLTEPQIKRLKDTLRRAAREGKEKGNYVAVRDWCILHIALDAGLRVSEICDLKIGDLLIDQGNSSIIVRSGKGDKKRGVSIGSELKSHLKSYIDWKEDHYEPTGDDDLLFLSPSGNSNKLSRQAVYHAFKRWADRAACPSGFQSTPAAIRTPRCFTSPVTITSGLSSPSSGIHRFRRPRFMRTSLTRTRKRQSTTYRNNSSTNSFLAGYFIYNYTLVGSLAVPYSTVIFHTIPILPWPVSGIYSVLFTI